jgi:DNA repair exonuclease SbcCD ATPase subunit
VRIERVRIEGFGPLSAVDVAWPEGKLLLVVDPNETGKSTFCEAIVTALFGLPRGRVSAHRTKVRFASWIAIAEWTGRRNSFGALDATSSARP